MNRRITAIVVVCILALGIVGVMALDRAGVPILSMWEDQDNSQIVVYGPGLSRHLLLGENTTHVVVEINYITGYAPTQSAIDTLIARMVDASGKTITLDMGVEIPSPASSSYTRRSLEFLERQYRRNPEEDGNTASIHILYLDGVYDGSSSVLGVAYNGTSIAIMKENIDSIFIPPRLQMTGQLTNADFETSVLIHEVGHLWGLVNIGYTSERKYEDSEHPHHSKHPDCVMYWAIETNPGNYMKPGSEGKPPTQFHEDALFDIEMIKAGLY